MLVYRPQVGAQVVTRVVVGQVVDEIKIKPAVGSVRECGFRILDRYGLPSFSLQYKGYERSRVFIIFNVQDSHVVAHRFQPAEHQAKGRAKPPYTP